MVNFASIEMDHSWTSPPGFVGWGGTNGLGTCLGVTVQVGEAFFAGHASCNTIVRRNTDPSYEWVLQQMTALMTAQLGPYDAAIHGEMYLVSGGSDQSTYAMRDGAIAWSQNANFTYLPQDSFVRQVDPTTMRAIQNADVPIVTATSPGFEIGTMPPQPS